MNDTAYDHTLIARALVAGKCRWEPFSGNDGRGELCANGMRYCTELDPYGVPALSGHTRALLTQLLPPIEQPATHLTPTQR